MDTVHELSLGSVIKLSLILYVHIVRLLYHILGSSIMALLTLNKFMHCFCKLLIFPVVDVNPVSYNHRCVNQEVILFLVSRYYAK